MTSESKVRTNRENAEKSTGPRTEAGKIRSSQNARKHGLYANQVVTPGEDPEVFEAFREDLHANLKPLGPLEEQLVERITVGLWRLRRVPEIEAALFAHSHHSVLRDGAKEKASAVRKQHTGYLDMEPIYRSNEIYAAAKERENKAEAALNSARPVLGATFAQAEPMLSRLTQIAAVTEASIYRALRELARLKGERENQAPERPMIEVHDTKPLPRRSREVN